jgi:hypothetical protein
MDALNGLVLLGDGTGKFIPQQLSESGFYVPGNGKALVSLHTASGHELMIASQNKGPVKVFQLRSQAKVLVIAPREISGIVTYLNGKTQRCEFPYGSSFLSQSARTLNITPGMKSISLSNGRGATRTVRLNGF